MGTAKCRDRHLRNVGQYDEDLVESREELRLNPNGGGYFDLLYSYLSPNRLEEAQSTVEEAQARLN